MTELIFKDENTPLAMPGMKITGRLVCKIGATEVEVLRIESNKRLSCYEVNATRDNFTHTFYPRTLQGLEEVMLIVSDFERSEQAESMEKKKEARKNEM